MKPLEHNDGVFQWQGETWLFFMDEPHVLVDESDPPRLVVEGKRKSAGHDPIEQHVLAAGGRGFEIERPLGVWAGTPGTIIIERGLRFRRYPFVVTFEMREDRLRLRLARFDEPGREPIVWKPPPNPF